MENRIGDKYKFNHSYSTMQTVTFVCTVVKVSGDFVIMRVPSKVVGLKFPPFGGKNLIKVVAQKLKEIQHSKVN